MQNDVGSAKKDARRLYVDGEWWLVYELELYDRRGASLVFESENVVRRVRTYPPHWREMADADLARLMDGA